jgi:polar amino acid transport system substrate-binding protein
MLTTDILKSLAPTGTLRAGVYTGNFLLITGKTPEGDPDGVSPDLCRAIAQKLGVPLQLIPFKSQDALVDAVGSNTCDSGFVGADPDRAAKVTFPPKPPTSCPKRQQSNTPLRSIGLGFASPCLRAAPTAFG